VRAGVEEVVGPLLGHPRHEKAHAPVLVHEVLAVLERQVEELALGLGDPQVPVARDRGLGRRSGVAVGGEAPGMPRNMLRGNWSSRMM
jgi:hypothetical protein